MPATNTSEPRTGLVLTGGGARGAYQVGALRAIAQLTPKGTIPFQVISGISAGAVNGAALAAGADDFRAATANLVCAWTGLESEQVYVPHPAFLARVGARWIGELAGSSGRLDDANPINGLLDTSPLRRVLAENIPLHRLPSHFASGVLRGLSVSATNYLTGTSVAFFDAYAAVSPWVRNHRMGVRDQITVDHLMASAAIPVLFPPIQLGDGFFGDGGIRMAAPFSAAVHLGAHRILAIHARHHPSPREIAGRTPAARRTSIRASEIAGTLLGSLLLDATDADAEGLERTNELLRAMPAEARARQPRRIVPLLVLTPSTDLATLADGAFERLPRVMRRMFRALGAHRRSEDLLSHLAFERVYLRDLMRLGYRDTMARRDEIEAFLEVDRPRRAPAREAAGAGAPTRRTAASAYGAS